MSGVSGVGSRNSLIIFVEILGFLTLLIITWLDEGFLVPHHWLPAWFGTATWHDALLESLAILAVAAPVIALSSRILKRLHYLEGFVRVCAWCRKVGVQDHWISMEEYLESTAQVSCTHGICEECSTKLTAEVSLPAGADLTISASRL